MRFFRHCAALAGGLTAAGFSGMTARAQEALETVGIPTPGAEGFQPAATELARDLHWLDGMLMYIIGAICVFVVALLLIVIFRFNHKANPTPARFTHNSLIEVIWTVVPIIVLIVIAIPSLQLLNKQVEVPEADMTIKATGYQWYWGYEYPDEQIAFDALMVGAGKATWEDVQADESTKSEVEQYGVTPETWKLATDNAVVVPVGKIVRLQVTGADVIHSWTVPAFGVKMDAVPGRLNETWFSVDRPGIYYGQCSELCGQAHAYMPIMVKALEQKDYDAWLEKAKQEFAEGPRTVDVAAAN